MAFGAVVVAGSLTATSNFYIKKSMDANPSSVGDPYIVERLFASALFVLIVTMSTTGFKFTWQMAGLGMIGGAFRCTYMWIIGQSIARGPAGLSLAIMNSSCIMPPFIMASLFGSNYGHSLTTYNITGGLLVAAGLIWLGYREKDGDMKLSWWKFVLTGFVVHALFLSFFQWRALLFHSDMPLSFLVPTHISTEGAESFVWMMFLSAGMIMLFPKLLKGQGLSVKKDMWKFGVLGGVFNGVGNFFLVKGTEMAATSNEKALIFPLFCVWLTFCNLMWGKYFYKEKIFWPAISLCFIGIFIGLT